MTVRYAILLICWAAACAQTPPPPVPGAPAPEATPLGKVEPPARPRLENAGRPMRVPVSCGEEEMHIFGLSCASDEPCPVYLELSDVESVGPKLFVSGNLHTSAATLSSIILASEDAGKTWFEPFERLRAAMLDQIQFFDFETGWIAGQTIQALPRDPFFLATADGGSTWRRRPVYDEARVASIEYFQFDSRTNGALILDRSQAGEPGVAHERLETMTGGDTWSLREVSSKPIRPKQPQKVESGWRVRVDAASKSYRVERRQGERWTPVASFLVHAGDCRAAERTLADPPPENAAPEKPAESETPRVLPPRKKPTLERKKP